MHCFDNVELKSLDYHHQKGENVNVCIHDFDDVKDKRFSSLIQVKNSEIQKITPESHIYSRDF